MATGKTKKAETILASGTTWKLVAQDGFVRFIGYIKLTQTTDAWSYVVDFNTIEGKYKPPASAKINGTDFELITDGAIRTTTSTSAGSYYIATIAWPIGT